MRWSRTTWLLCSVAVLVRLAVLCVTGRLLALEPFEYDVMAENLLAGRGLVYECLGLPYASFTGPVYPALRAAVSAVTGSSPLAMAVVQLVLSSLIPAVVANLGRELCGERAGLFAGLWATIHPGFLIYTTKSHPLVLEALLVGGVAWGALWLRRQPSWQCQAGVGLALGLAILSRPTAVLLLGLVVLWVCAGRRTARSAAWRAALGTVLIAVGVVLPWTLRNYRIHHQLVVVQSTSGMSFWKGNNPRATGGNLDAQGRDWRSQIPAPLQARLNAAQSEVEHDHLFWQDAIQHVARDPTAFFERVGKKLVAFWWRSPTTGQTYPSWYALGYQGWLVVVMLLGGVGIWRSVCTTDLQRRRDVLALLLVCAALSLVQSLFYVEGRHRWLLDPLLLVMTGQGSAWVLERFRRPIGC